MVRAITAIISADVKEEGFKKVLQWSSGRLIDVTCEISPLGVGQNSDEYLGEFLDSLGTIIGRWRTLDLTCLGDAHERSVRDVLGLPALNLERVVLHDELLELDISDVELFGGDSPKLKDVRIVGMACGWSQEAFKGLENLHLSWVSFDGVEPILRILRDSPQLQKLAICECDIAGNSPGPTQPVSLPNLRILYIALDDDEEQTPPTERLLNLISAPLSCALYTTIFGIEEEEEGEEEEEDSLKARFEKWVFGRQSQKVLEGLDGLEMHLGGSQVPGCYLEFSLSSGCSSINGGVRAWDTGEAVHAISCVQNMLQRSLVLEIFTTLTISSSGVPYFEDRNFVSQFNRLPPITHLELVGLSSLSESALLGEIFCGSTLDTPSPFATVRHFTFREMHLDIVSGTIQAALGNPETETGSTSKTQIDRLDHLEVHVEEKEFARAEQVVKALRECPRIGKVDLYVVL
ncbi:hypothetical protein FRC01_003779 [Tulasnella sp. 417]|nr:hypothetical protein FRC01_003779 [Tulasnella sp. 417]